MAARNSVSAVIIKRKKIVQGGGHHGGAWKVAYADFVTAMMAFFMLMWLLNATTEKQRKGIADYFSPTIPINRVSGGGDGAFGGESVFADHVVAQSGTGATSRNQTAERQAAGDSGVTPGQSEAERRLVAAQAQLELELTAAGGESMLSPDVARHIVTRITDEGLIVEFFDLDDEPLFSGETATPTEVTEQIAGMLARVFGLVDNEVAVNGHIHAFPDVLRVNPEWNLSTERAQVFRGLLEASAFPRERVQRVTGFADRKLAVKNPMAARNNRLELILLREGR